MKDYKHLGYFWIVQIFAIPFITYLISDNSSEWLQLIIVFLLAQASMMGAVLLTKKG